MLLPTFLLPLPLHYSWIIFLTWKCNHYYPAGKTLPASSFHLSFVLQLYHTHLPPPTFRVPQMGPICSAHSVFIHLPDPHSLRKHFLQAFEQLISVHHTVLAETKTSTSSFQGTLFPSISEIIYHPPYSAALNPRLLDGDQEPTFYHLRNNSEAKEIGHHFLKPRVFHMANPWSTDCFKLLTKHLLTYYDVSDTVLDADDEEIKKT